MLRFESPIYLYLLVFIPIFFGLMALAEYKRHKAIKKLGDTQLIVQLMPDASAKRRWIKFSVLQFALMLLIMMLARPQMGTKVSNEKRDGIECIICLDISNSMKAEDVQPSRLDKSKMLIENLVDKFNNDKIGLIVFAGDAFVQLPITSDYVSAKMFLQSIDPTLIQTQGTDIAQAINLASNSFTQQDKIGKAIIVITDGEDHEGGAAEAAKAAKDKGMNVFILGIGNTSGTPIPDGHGGYMTDNTGATVMSALNEQMCREVASAGKGTYIHVDNTSTAQEQLNDELAKLQQGTMKSVVYSEYNEQFQVFGVLCILFLIIEICINETMNPFFKKIKLFQRTVPGAKVMLLMLMLGWGSIYAFAQNDRTHIRMGNRAFRGSNAEKAEVEYRKALTQNQNNPQALYNLGCTYMQQNKDSVAARYLEKSVQVETSKYRKSMAYHNLGVIAQRHQMYGEAIKFYEQSLRLNPNDDQTRYNLVLCKRQQKNQPKNNDKQNQKKNDKNKKDKDKQKQNQDKKEQQKQQQQPKDQMSKDNAEQLLQAAMQEEKNTQQKLKKAMQQPQRRNIQKNW